MCTVTYSNTLQQSSVHVSGRGVENLKTCEQGIFHRVRTCEKPCEMGVCLTAACMHVAISPPPPSTKQYNVELTGFCPCACKWTTLIHLLSEGRGHRRIGVLWVTKYKTYFVQDSIATYASLKIITKGIFSWKAWLNETINTFSSHMKLDKINCILIDDGLLNLKDLEILTSVVSDFK